MQPIIARNSTKYSKFILKKKLNSIGDTKNVNKITLFFFRKSSVVDFASTSLTAASPVS